ncbi:hypothetical protein [Methylobacterium sp. WL9]|uniref:hypothetical protein n=1 Tax=Methylobacterium sp. WL9 TaxID=2603898 RepID=UPI0011CA00EB|nr:hypothetical protein [Methylobacterium sp. WL9]TXN24009.1 hypothetical protein FV217_04905 [Methylobacterium sp. WL9]
MSLLGPECHCEDPIIRCDDRGCHCDLCGGYERIDLLDEPVAPARPTETAEIREAAPYVLMKRGLYWCPNGQGYTGVLAEAGRYSEEAARARHGHEPGSTTMRLASDCAEFAPACWPETQIKVLRAQRDAALAERDEAREERDALLGAAGFKPGSFRSALTRKVILDDVAGMRPEMVKARRQAARVQGDADLWTMRMLEEWPGDTLLLRLWRQKKEAKAERDAATAQADRTAGELAAAEAEKVRRTTPRPIAEYHEDFGFVTWWIFPVCEPAWIGSPNDSDWPGYHTHFTPHPDVQDPTEEPPHAE